MPQGMNCRIVFLAIMFSVSDAFAQEPEIVSAIDGCPTMTHVPVVGVPRGVPVLLEAMVECDGGSLSEVVLQVRLTDVGKPKAVEMKGEGNGLYEAAVPVSMIEGIPRFWYYIDVNGMTAQGEQTRVQTSWHAVDILDPTRSEERGRASAAKGGYYWLAGGAAVLGGTFAVHKNEHSHGEQLTPTAAPATSGTSDSGGVSSSPNPPSPPSGGAPPPPSPLPSACVSTPLVSFGNSSPCATGDLAVYVCGVCAGAGISVLTSWGEQASSVVTLENTCDVDDPIWLPIGKPSLTEIEAPESEWIQVWIGSDLVTQIS